MKATADILRKLSWQRAIILLAAVEFILLFISDASFSGLYGANFFDFGVDLFFSLFYATALPQLIVQQLWLGIALDAAVLILMMLLYRNTANHKTGIALFLLSLLLYVTLMGYLTHRNYHAGLFLVWVPFMFRPGNSRTLAYEATRYYLLFFYASAGMLKIFHGTLNDVNNFSANLLNQFKPYFVEGNTGLRTDINLYLVHYAPVAYAFLLAATAAELICLAGFFTKKWDRVLGWGLLLFHCFNWLLMDIAPVGQLAFVCLLFAGRAFRAPEHAGSSLR